MTETLKTSMIAINKWLFHGWNYKTVPVSYSIPGATVTTYVPEFIKEVKWTCSLDHIIKKWEKASESRDPDNYMVKFYAELGGQNRILMLEWIMQNYNDEKSLF